MSGPVEPPDTACENRSTDTVDVIEGRRASVGGLAIARVLPTKGRRTVGPWCFVDLMMPSDADDPDPMEVGPHPHIGLATATWLLEGEAVHGDSLGTEQPLRPGQLNLMTAGHGIAHAELELGRGLRGVQMWLAQPEATRHGQASFKHHGELPAVAVPAGGARILAGTFGGETSPARLDWPTIGLELDLDAGERTIPVDPEFEHAVVPLDHPVRLQQAIVEPGWIGYVPAGPSTLSVTTRLRGKAMLLGGRPFEARPLMFWNFVARDRDEISQAYRDWQARNTDRFAAVPSDLERIDSPRPPWLTGDD